MAIDLNDKTANGNNLTNTTADEVTTGLPFAQSTIAALFVRANSDRMTAADSASTSITNTMTLEFWIKFTSALSTITSFTETMSKDNGTDQRTWAQYVLPDGTVHMIIFGGGVNDDFYWSPTTNAGTWYHWAFTITPANASATTFEMFVNGTSQGNGTSTNSGNVASMTDSTQGITIGNRGDLGADYVDATIDDIRIWNTIRTTAQIADNRSIELTGSESGLAVYWPYEADLGAPAAGGGFFNYF